MKKMSTKTSAKPLPVTGYKPVGKRRPAQRLKPVPAPDAYNVRGQKGNLPPASASKGEMPSGRPKVKLQVTSPAQASKTMGSVIKANSYTDKVSRPAIPGAGALLAKTKSMNKSTGSFASSPSAMKYLQSPGGSNGILKASKRMSASPASSNADKKFVRIKKG